jgi:hypothetical protein
MNVQLVDKYKISHCASQLLGSLETYVSSRETYVSLFSATRIQKAKGQEQNNLVHHDEKGNNFRPCSVRSYIVSEV